jgi:hypothetical protein
MYYTRAAGVVSRFAASPLFLSFHQFPPLIPSPSPPLIPSPSPPLLIPHPLPITTGKDADVKEDTVEVVKSPSPPWGGLLTHPAALALYFNHFAMNWGGYTLM